LHQLGDQRLPGETEGALLTRRGDGTLVAALWNYAEPGAPRAARRVVLTVTGSQARTASVQSLDAEHGNFRAAYRAMGSPRYPTQRQLTALRTAAALPAPVTHPLPSTGLTLDIAPDGLVLVTIPATAERR
jgi:xylan 1,4-beta-xylosidase